MRKTTPQKARHGGEEKKRKRRAHPENPPRSPVVGPHALDPPRHPRRPRHIISILCPTLLVTRDAFLPPP
uniref:Uncharacterized protein n=1 Tax=Leersia perrieri TaxID=77586 RepID=A0A0D9VY65_9ORYZ